MEEFYDDIVKDYERSFIGSFSQQVITEYCGPESPYELYFTVSKFEGNMGYSLTQNYEEIRVEFDINGPTSTNDGTTQQNTEEHVEKTDPTQRSNQV